MHAMFQFVLGETVYLACFQSSHVNGHALNLNESVSKAPFTRYRFHSISDWPPVYTRTHQSDALHTVFAFSNENALRVA